MRRIVPIAFWLVLAGALPFLVWTTGCQTGERQPAVRPAPAATVNEPTDVMAQSDTNRAEAAIERDQRERSGERRPFEPEGTRAVDQPRVGAGRR